MIEALIYLGFLVFAMLRREWRAAFGRVALPYRLASAALIGLLVVGQLVANGHRYFPLVLWAMYTRSAPSDPVVFEFTAVSDRGEDAALDVLGEAGRLGLRWPLLRVIHRHDRATTEAARAEAEQEIRARLAAIVGEIRDRGGDPPVAGVRVWRRRIPIHDYRGPESIPRELLWEVAAEEMNGAG